MRLLECAKILTTHGIKGEVKIKIITDDLNRFNKGNILYVGDEKEVITINSFRMFKGMGLITINNITNINDVLKYIVKSIYVDTDMYDDDSIYYDDLIGCNVFDKGKLIGICEDVMEVPQGEILVIKLENGKQGFVPFVDEFIKEIDIEKKQIDIESIEGLLWK